METKQFTAATDSSCQFQAVIATLNATDSDNDVVLPGAFGNREGIPVLVAHDSNRIPVGKVDIFEQGDEVVATGELIDLEACRWLRFDAAKPPSRQEFSWGFIPTKVSFGEHDGEEVRFIQDLDLLEVSLVLRGASVNTRLLDVKSMTCSCGCDGDCEQSEREQMELEIATLDAVIGYKQLQVAELRKWSYVDAGEYHDPLGVKMAKFAARELGVPVPPMRRLRRASWLKCDVPTFKIGREVLGLHKKGVVYILDGLDSDDTAEVVAHEIAHYAEHRKGRKTGEEFATMFGEIFAATWAPRAVA